MSTKDLFAEEMVEKYKGLLRDNAGIKSVSVDGQSVSYDDIQKQYNQWKKILDSSTGKKAMVSQINLSNF